MVTDADALVEFFKIAYTELEMSGIVPRYNIAPSQPILAVRQSDAGRELVSFRWGLVPFWSKDPKSGYKMINARAETVSTKPAYRTAFKHRRCLIPATGFYEWKLLGERKQPYHIQSNNHALMAFAGIWERWKGEKEKIIESCSIIVTDANETIRTIHDRMPVILSPENHGEWLDLDNANVEQLQNLLRPYSAGLLEAYPITTKVNNARNEGPEILARVS